MVVASGAYAAGCTDDDNPSGPNLNLDAGLDVSNPDTSSPDGTTPTPDAGVDAPVSKEVTVKVTSFANTPIANVKVAFYEGTNVTVVATNAAGEAKHEMSGTGHVTVADGSLDGSKRLTTFLSVEPGDVLAAVGGPVVQSPADPTIGMIEWGTVATFAGATSHEFSIGCSSDFLENSTPGITVPQSCGTGQPFQVLGIARDNDGILAYMTKAVTLDTDAGADAGTATLNVASGDWIAATTTAMTFAGTVPPFTSSYSQVVSTWKSGFQYLNKFDGSNLPDDAGIPIHLTPAAFGAQFLRIHGELGMDNGGLIDASDFGMFSTSVVLEQRALPLVGNVTRNWGDFLPRVQIANVESLPAPKVAWATQAPVNGVGGLMYMSGGLERDGDIETIEWRVVFPPGATSATVPALPAELADFVPTGDLALQYLGLLDSPEVQTYRNFVKIAPKYFYFVDGDDPVSLPATAPFTVKVTAARAAGG